MNNGLQWTSYVNNMDFNATYLDIIYNLSNPLSQISSGIVTSLQTNNNVPSKNPDINTFTLFRGTTNVGVKFTGFFVPNQTGNWSFTLSACNDYGVLFLGPSGKDITPSSTYSLSTTLSTTNPIAYVKHNSVNSNTSSNISLTSGTYYPILLYVGQYNGDYNFGLSFTPPGGTAITDFTGYIYNTTIINPIDVSTNNTYNYLVFHKSCDIRFNSNVVGNCLMVGGGGGGGNYLAGAGGAGGVAMYNNIAFNSNTTYNIKIGNGGLPQKNGEPTTIKSGGSLLTDNTIAYGGGYGGSRTGWMQTIAYAADFSSNTIGSGGGGTSEPMIGLYDDTGVLVINYTGGKTNSGQGNNGGSGLSTYGGGGGGGAGAVGQAAGTYTISGISKNTGGNGGNGTTAYASIINDISTNVDVIINGWYTATNGGYIGGGGSGATYNYTGNYYSTPGLGGGGQGALWVYSPITIDTISYSRDSVVKYAGNGFPNTGGGGGGGSDGFNPSAGCITGGSGGSGIIIMQFSKDTIIQKNYTINPATAGTGTITASALSLTGYLNSYSATNQNYINSINSSNSFTTGSFSGNLVSLNASYLVASSVGFTINSDQRIKKNIAPLSSADSLEIVKSLKPCQFNYIDYMKGTVSKYGYLAQEVENVLPYVVHKNQAYIPNFFENIHIENQHKIILDEKTTESLAIGTNVQFYDIENEIHFRQVHEIVDEKTFIITEPFPLDQGTLFLYGQEVHDYRSIDTDQINTILLSALQGTDKTLEKQKDRLEKLKTKWSEYKKKNSNLE